MVDFKCIVCNAPLSGKQKRFCSQKHAMDWHNSKAPWRELQARYRKNAKQKAERRANPEFWRNRQKAYREAHPEYVKAVAVQTAKRHEASPWRRCVIGAKQRAKIKNHPFDLTFEWAESRWTGFCELTNIPFGPGPFAPSLDRIIPELGYVQTNCRFVLLGINGLKNIGSDDAMYLIAEALLAHRQKL